MFKKWLNGCHHLNKCFSFNLSMYGKEKFRNQTLLFTFIFLFLLIISTQPNYALDIDITLTEISQVDISSTLFDVDLEGENAYISDYSRSLFHIIDISEVTNPTKLGNFSVNLPHYCDVQNDIAYIAAWTSGVQIFNISNPSSVPNISEFTPGTVGALEVEQDLLFVGSDYGFNIVNISDPNTPENITYYYTGSNVHDFFIVDQKAYVMSWNLTTGTSWALVINFSDVENPFEESAIDLGSVCYDIHVIGEYAYFAASYNGIKIVDFGDLTTPLMILDYDLVGEAFALEVRDDLLYLGNGYSGLEIYDVANKTNPVFLDEIMLGGSAEELELKDNYIYVAVDGVGLVIVHIEGLENTSKTALLPILFLFLPIALMVSRRRFISLSNQR